MNDILLAFIPMFFAMDPIGILPIFIGLTAGMEKKARDRIIVQSLVTAGAVAVGFIFLGHAIFKFLGITMPDFMIAGGVILFCLSMLDLTGQNESRQKLDDVGAVPIGTPLIVGPAVLTMALMLMAQKLGLPELGYVHKPLKVISYAATVEFEDIHTFTILEDIDALHTVWVGFKGKINSGVAEMIPDFPIDPAMDLVLERAGWGGRYATLFMGGYAIDRYQKTILYLFKSGQLLSGRERYRT